jgi:rod shape-determining protein MreD
MIVTPPILLRLALLALCTAIVELSFTAQTSVLGATPDLAVLVVMSLGLLGGSATGAVCGFSIGILIDTLMLETLGATALTLIAVGYVAGRYRETVGHPTRGVTALLGGGLTLSAALCFAFIQLMLGVGATVSPLVVRDIVVASVLGAVFAVPVHALIRRLLRPALIEDRPRSSRPVAPTPVGSRR